MIHVLSTTGSFSGRFTIGQAALGLDKLVTAIPLYSAEKGGCNLRFEISNLRFAIEPAKAGVADDFLVLAHPPHRLYTPEMRAYHFSRGVE
jgi:hypothetical protein